MLPRIRGLPALDSGTATIPSEATRDTNDINNTTSTELPDGPSTSVVDIVSPLSPSTINPDHTPVPRHSTAIDDGGALELTRLLSTEDLPDRCRSSGVMIVVFYVLSIVAWPAIVVSVLGCLCGTMALVACIQPYTVHRFMMLYVFLSLNIILVVALWATAVSRFFFRDDRNEVSSIDDVYIGGFIVVGTLLHLRSIAPAREIVRKCNLWSTIVDEVWPQRWRRQRPSVDDDESRLEEPRPHSGSEQRGQGENLQSSEQSGSVHSFELDVERVSLGNEWNRSNSSSVASLRSEPPSSPVSLYQRMGAALR